MARAARMAAFFLCCALGTRGAVAEGTYVPPTPEQLAAQERVRPKVTAIWEDLRTPATPGQEHRRGFWDISERLIALGPDAVPFLVAEVDLTDPVSFNIAAYALGRLGGPDAEAALRKAARSADGRGGRFGLACKKWALFGLALLGKPDVFELAQTGSLQLHQVEMVPDLPFIGQLASIVGRDATPVLTRQLDAFARDPAAADRFQDTVIALGYAGDATAGPKLVPLLTNESKAIRTSAADALSRIGEPALCESVLPLLASADRQERELAAAALDRWRPEPCFKAMVGRLEVESDLTVRSHLYAAIAAMGGESTLPVFRSVVATAGPLDVAMVLDAVGSIGSKKGLNMLRAMIPNGDTNVVLHALQAIASIGGEGAMDTLLAASSDGRRLIASSAEEILTDLGERRAAPRLAEDLLALVAEPVGDVGLRPQIVQLTEGLVALRFTEPLDRIKTAVTKQSDTEIVESLTSCARRLELLAKHRDDAAAWADELASPRKEIRRLAGQRLAEIGSPAALRVLASHLERTDVLPDERAGILTALGGARAQGSADLVERHLADAAFDDATQHDVRAAAAYAARRIGGERMSKALRTSAARRDGRDWATLVYLAAADKRAAIDTLTALRGRRLRYPEARSAEQDEQAQRLLKDLAAGRSIAWLDVRPEHLEDR